jgi:hypothetical protein
MVLSLPLSPELETRLRREAERQGISMDTLMLDLLDKYLPQEAESRRAAAVAMLQNWAEEDATQRCCMHSMSTAPLTGSYLRGS